MLQRQTLIQTYKTFIVGWASHLPHVTDNSDVPTTDSQPFGGK